jgi:tetratricopeptide (TPR) repeat protein
MKTLPLLLTALVLAACSRTDTTQSVQPLTSDRITPTSASAEAVAQFERGQVLLDNLRTPEAALAFDEALKLDPGFVLAEAFHGQATPGPQGLKEIESAASKSGGLSEPERVLIEGLLAARRGEGTQANEAYTRLASLAPGDARPHYYLGVRLLGDQKYAEAAQALRKAVELDPQSGGARNMLGYAALRQGDTAGAISAFTEYARMLPQEPNPQDSLGEALLAAGRFPEAEAAFARAAELSPSFWNAWDGMAYAKFFAGDWAGGREALEKARSATRRPVDTIAVNDLLAAAAAAQGNQAEALKTLDASEALAGVQPSDVAFVPLRRAQILLDAGRPRDALSQVSAALQRAESGQFPPGLARNLRREALRARLAVELRLNNAAAAQQTSTALDQEAALRPGDPDLQSAMHFGRGVVAMLKGDMAAARAQFEQCSALDDVCRWQGVLAAEKAGDQAGAAALRGRLLAAYVRDPTHLYVRTRLTGSPRARDTA